MQLPAKATLAEADALLSALDAAIPKGGGSLRIDASTLQHFDTSLVAVLLHTRRVAQTGGGGIEIVGAPPKLIDLARLYGVESLLPLAGPADPAAAAEP